MKNTLICLACLLLIFRICPLFTGTMGKLSARIMDAEIKEPIPSVNVALAGTTLADIIADSECYYHIINIFPERYNVNLSSMGLYHQEDGNSSN